MCFVPHVKDGCQPDSDLEDDDITTTLTDTSDLSVFSFDSSLDLDFSSCIFCWREWRVKKDPIGGMCPSCHCEVSDGRLPEWLPLKSLDLQDDAESVQISDGTESTLASIDSEWTIYTEVSDGEKCFLPGTSFLKADATPELVPVHGMRGGDQLQGPFSTAAVTSIIPRPMKRRYVITIGTNLPSDMVKTKVTSDHRLLLSNGTFRRAWELKVGDEICTTEGNFPIANVHHDLVETEIFQVSIAKDRAVYIKMFNMTPGMVAAFGADQRVPYHPSQYIEFRFKGPICSMMGSAEAWLTQEDFTGRLSGFDMQFWTTRAFAVWVSQQLGNAFWKEVTSLLSTSNAPKGSKIRRQPSHLSTTFAEDLELPTAVITPTP